MKVEKFKITKEPAIACQCGAYSVIKKDDPLVCWWCGGYLGGDMTKHNDFPPMLTQLKIYLDDIKNELVIQEEKGNLLNGAGVCLMVLVEKAIKDLDILEKGQH